jgi:hypothetical protein
MKMTTTKAVRSLKRVYIMRYTGMASPSGSDIIRCNLDHKDNIGVLDCTLVVNALSTNLAPSHGNTF